MRLTFLNSSYHLQKCVFWRFPICWYDMPFFPVSNNSCWSKLFLVPTKYVPTHRFAKDKNKVGTRGTCMLKKYQKILRDVYVLLSRDHPHVDNSLEILGTNLGYKQFNYLPTIHGSNQNSGPVCCTQRNPPQIILNWFPNSNRLREFNEIFDRNRKITQIIILKHPPCQKDSDWIWKRQERGLASPRNADGKREVRGAQTVPKEMVSVLVYEPVCWIEGPCGTIMFESTLKEEIR